MMDVVNEVVGDVSNSLKGLFTGGTLGGMSSKTKKIIGIAVLIIAIIIGAWFLWSMAKKYSGKGFSPRNVGAAGCCAKAQLAARAAVTEPALSQQDLDEENQMYAEAGMPKISTQYAPLAYDNYNYTQGFASPAAKPTANQDSSVADNWNGNKPLVQQQVPNSYNMKPSYEESDFINMAYSG